MSKSSSRKRKRRSGGANILVNNAGVYEFAPIEDVTPERFQMFDLNVLGLILASRLAVDTLEPTEEHHQHQLGSRDVDHLRATSVWQHFHQSGRRRGYPGACQGTWAAEIRFNSINPGMVETEGVHSAGIADSDFRKQTEAQTPLGRIGQPNDIAPTAVFLASSDSGWITGETFYISGGLR